MLIATVYRVAPRACGVFADERRVVAATRAACETLIQSRGQGRVADCHKRGTPLGNVAGNKSV